MQVLFLSFLFMVETWMPCCPSFPNKNIMFTINKLCSCLELPPGTMTTYSGQAIVVFPLLVVESIGLLLFN